MGAKMAQMGLFGDLDARDLVPPPLSVEPEPDMVRVAPGRHAWVPKRAATPPPEYVVCRWSKQADGTWAPVPVAGRYVRLDSSTATLLGFPARAGADERERCRYDTILRLGRAGFVDLVRVAPNTILLDLDSWYRHLADCMDDPDRWEDGRDDRKTYLKANGLGGWRQFVQLRVNREQ